jgi:IS30 family transposase
MVRHLAITQSLGAPVYFCDSRSPWQRGSNENTVSLVVARLGWSGRLVPAA